MNKRNITRARNKIDKIDNKIFDLIKKRTKVVKYMLKQKKFKKDIVDKKRENKILKKIKMKSIKNKVDTSITLRIWKSIILSYTEYQKETFRRK